MGSLSPESLYPRRLAWRALSMVLEDFNLAGITLKLNPDDPTQVIPGAEPGEMWFHEDFGRRGSPLLAAVFVDGAAARVIVERVERLVRRKHLREFHPSDVGIVHRAGAPDIDARLDLSEVIDTEGEMMRAAKQRILPPASRPVRPATVIRAFGGCR